MLGARNFVVFEIGAIGCLPVMLNTPQPMPPNTRFLDQVNSLVSIYNAKLAAKLNELGSFLKCSKFVLAKAFGFTQGSFLLTMGFKIQEIQVVQLHNLGHVFQTKHLAKTGAHMKRYAAATQPSRTP
nr:hypothetical protein CFP56_52697 [Quercus suber]